MRCRYHKVRRASLRIMYIFILNNNRNSSPCVQLLIIRFTVDFASLPILFFPDEIIVQKPELTSPSICHAPGGEYFVEGETWNIDSCTQCTCHSGRVLCETEVCPPLLCQNPTRSQDSCCPQCPGTCWHPAVIRALPWSEDVWCFSMRMLQCVLRWLLWCLCSPAVCSDSLQFSNSSAKLDCVQERSYV